MVKLNSLRPQKKLCSSQPLRMFVSCSRQLNKIGNCGEDCNMIKYWQVNHTVMIDECLQHLRLVIGSLAIAVMMAVMAILLTAHRRKWLNTLIYLFSLIYSIPSFSFFVLLLPLTGLGTTSATIVLVAYAEYVLLRNFVTGIQNVDPHLITTAEGLGMTPRQIFWQVQIPLALPSFFSGIQV